MDAYLAHSKAASMNVMLPSLLYHFHHLNWGIGNGKTANGIRQKKLAEIPFDSISQ